MGRIQFGRSRSDEVTLASCIGLTLFLSLFFVVGLVGTVLMVMAYLNPKNDEGPVLLVFLLIPLLFMGIGVGVPFFTWRKYLRKRRGLESAISAEAPTARKRKLGMLGMVGFFTIFFLMGSAFFYLMFVGPVMNILAARSWVATPCVIEHSELTSHRSDGDTTYGIEMRYQYEYDGRMYESDRYWFITGSSSNYSGRKAVVDAHAPGTETTCYVDPENPSKSVIERGFPNELWFGLFPLIFVLVGLGGMVGVPVYQWRKANRDPKRAWLPEGGAIGTASSFTAPDAEAAGPVTLRPGVSRRNRLLGTIAFATVWNGFVWTLLYFLHTEMPWFALLIIGLFALVGVGLIGAIGYNAMAMFNPIVELTIDTKRPVLGQMLDVNWRIDGAASRLQKLAVTLEGQEKATYRRGTNTHTDTETFASLPVQILEDAAAIQARKGAAQVQVPGDTMHSFEADNNEIIWSLKVHGEVPRWPDVSDEYRLTLLPQHMPEREGVHP